MRRAKGPGGWKSGGRQNQPAGGFVALGASKTEGKAEEAKPSAGAKRPSESSAGQLESKNVKLEMPSSSAAVPNPSFSSEQLIDDSTWLALATHPVSPSLLLHKIESAEEKLKTTRVPKILCSVAKELSEHRHSDPDPAYASGLAYLARAKAAYFQEKEVTAAFASLLRPKGRPTSANLLHLVANILATAFAEAAEWPLLFVKLYLEDSLGERAWVEREEAGSFVRGILTSFPAVCHTPAHIRLLIGGSGEEGNAKAPGSPSPSALKPSVADAPAGDSEITGIISLADTPDEDPGMDLLSALEGTSVEAVETPRFSAASRDAAEAYVLGLLRDAWARQSGPNAASAQPALLKTMPLFLGLEEVRNAAVNKLDGWLGTGKVQRAALGLLAAVCLNIAPSPEQLDLLLFSSIAKLRCLKSKAVLPVFAASLRELMGREGVVQELVRAAVLNEMSSPRGPINMYILQQAFSSQVHKMEAARGLGHVMVQMLGTSARPEEPLRPVRVMFRELGRSGLRCDFPLLPLVKSIMKAGSNLGVTQAERGLDWRQRVLDALCDLICLAVFLRHSTAIRDAVTTKKGLETSGLLVFLEEVRAVKEEGLRWLGGKAVEVFSPSSDVFIRALWQLLFIEKAEWYSGKDGWPADAERNLILRTIGEAGVSEATLKELLEMGLAARVPLLSSAALDVCESIVRKAAAASVAGGRPLEVLELELINPLLHSTTYKPPNSITLPTNYRQPQVSVSILYWKAWAILLLIGARNPTTIGKKIWETYPSARLLMEAVIIGEFTWPPQTAASEQLTLDDLISKDLQEREHEKAGIIQLEDFLAKASDPAAHIHEANSHLLPLLISLDPKGPARRPPQEFLVSLQALDSCLNIGRRLSQSRQPDFLLELLSRSSSSLAQPWLVRLMESKEEGSIAVLPVQCLCEFLIHQMGQESSSQESRAEMEARLEAVIWNGQSDGQGQVALTYFFQRLASPEEPERNIAHTLLPRLLRAEPAQSQAWLDYVLILPNLSSLLPALTPILLRALKVETQPERLAAFLSFLLEHENAKLAGPLARLVLQRPAALSAIFPGSGDWAPERLQLLEAMLVALREGSGELEATDEAITCQLSWVGEVKTTVEVGRAAALLIALWPPGQKPSGSMAHLVDAREQLKLEWMETAEMTEELWPSWLRLRLLEAGNPWAVSKALAAASAETLLDFVQRYGMLASAVAAVLAALDEAKQQRLSEIVADYTRQQRLRLTALVRAQMRRVGDSKTGTKFLRLLQDLDQKDAREAKEGHVAEVTAMEAEESQSVEQIDWEAELSESDSQLQDRLQRQETRKKKSSLIKLPDRPQINMDELLREYSEERRREALSEILAQLEAVAAEAAPSTRALAQASAAVRRWSQLDPEMIQLFPQRSLALILGHKGFEAQKILLSLLLHQCSTHVLRGLLSQLLSHHQKEFSPKRVLDLVGEFLCLPRFQFVKDRTVSRYAGQKDLLRLSEADVCVALEYVEAEAADGLGSIEARMELVEALIVENRGRLKASLEHLAGRKEDSAEAGRLFRQLSFRHPLHEMSELGSGEDVSGSWTGLDAVLYEAIMEAFRLGESGKSEDAELERVMGSLHAWAKEQPQLLARQLPLVAALLKGTTSLFMRAYAQTNWLSSSTTSFVYSSPSRPTPPLPPTAPLSSKSSLPISTSSRTTASAPPASLTSFARC